MKKLKTKSGDDQKKRSGREIGGVSPEAGREDTIGLRETLGSRAQIKSINIYSYFEQIIVC